MSFKEVELCFVDICRMIFIRHTVAEYGEVLPKKDLDNEIPRLF